MTSLLDEWAARARKKRRAAWLRFARLSLSMVIVGLGAGAGAFFHAVTLGPGLAGNTLRIVLPALCAGPFGVFLYLLWHGVSVLPARMQMRQEWTREGYVAEWGIDWLLRFAPPVGTLGAGIGGAWFETLALQDATGVFDPWLFAFALVGAALTLFMLWVVVLRKRQQ